MFLWSFYVLQVLVFLPYHVAASVYKKYQSQRNPYTSLGHSNFTKLVIESEIFVDKTLFIKDFLESPSDVVMVTCPRRWGKSMNIDMLKTFLQVAVGVTRPKTSKIFARLDKFQENHMLYSDFYNHFGFTAEEVLELCRAFNFLPTQHAHVTTCYGGYAFINTPITLFNSDSVLRYLPEQIAQPYWEKEGDLGPYEGLFSEKNINNTVMAILNGTGHDLNLDNLTLTTEDLFNLSHMVRGDTTLAPEESVALFLRLIFSHGYLTIDKERTSESKNIAVVKVPNEEIAIILREKLGVET